MAKNKDQDYHLPMDLPAPAAEHVMPEAHVEGSDVGKPQAAESEFHMAHAPEHPVPENQAPTHSTTGTEHGVSTPTPEMAAGSKYVLPRYQVHSEVYAAPIHAIDAHHIHVDGGDNPNVMQLVMVERPKGIFERGEAALGDYLIVHKDGAMSWMPKRAFEATHDRLPDEGPK